MSNQDRAIEIKNEALAIIESGVKADMPRVGQMLVELAQIIDSGRSVAVARAVQTRIYESVAANL